MPCLRPQAGSSRRLAVGKAELAPALVAMDHLAGDEPGRAEQFGRLHHLALRSAPRAPRRRRPGGPRPRAAARCRPKSRAGRPAPPGKAGEPARFLPKWKSKPIAAPPMPKRPTRMRATKSAAEVAASAASKVITIAPSSPVAASSRSLVALARELEQRVLRPQEKPRMRLEGQRRGLAGRAPRARERRADHGAMAAMHAVEIADRHHGAAQRADDGRRRARHESRRVDIGRLLDAAHFAASALRPFAPGYG